MGEREEEGERNGGAKKRGGDDGEEGREGERGGDGVGEEERDEDVGEDETLFNDKIWDRSFTERVLCVMNLLLLLSSFLGSSFVLE